MLCCGRPLTFFFRRVRNYQNKKKAEQELNNRSIQLRKNSLLFLVPYGQQMNVVEFMLVNFIYYNTYSLRWLILTKFPCLHELNSSTAENFLYPKIFSSSATYLCTLSWSCCLLLIYLWYNGAECVAVYDTSCENELVWRYFI